MNIYGNIKGLSKSEIASLFERNGWYKRKCSWTDYEIQNNWSELVIEGDDFDCLINGILDYSIERIDIIKEILSITEISSFNLELYDEDELVQKI